VQEIFNLQVYDGYFQNWKKNGLTDTLLSNFSIEFNSDSQCQQNGKQKLQQMVEQPGTFIVSFAAALSAWEICLSFVNDRMGHR